MRGWGGRGLLQTVKSAPPTCAFAGGVQNTFFPLSLSSQFNLSPTPWGLTKLGSVPRMRRGGSLPPPPPHPSPPLPLGLPLLAAHGDGLDEKNRSAFPLSNVLSISSYWRTNAYSTSSENTSIFPLPDQYYCKVQYSIL